MNDIHYKNSENEAHSNSLISASWISCESNKNIPLHITERSLLGRENGSVTLEAAIAFPVFVCIVVFFGFILKCVYVHEKVQHAITQAAIEIAGTSYVYGISGGLETQRELEAKPSQNGGNNEDTIVKSLSFENWMPGAASDTTTQQIEFALSALNQGLDGILFSQYAKHVTMKYLLLAPNLNVQNNQNNLNDQGEQNTAGGDPLFRALNVKNGMNGFNFLGSAYLDKGSDQVVIKVKYTLEIPVFLQAFSEINITQKAAVRAWLFENTETRVLNDEEREEEDIWSLSNFERGKKIRELFHGNLPTTFPGISGYEHGTATLIKSLDTTTASYQNAATLTRVVNSYINELKVYHGQNTPWGRDEIIIRTEDIVMKRLVLVIPSNEISDEVSAAIDVCIQYALSNGIYMQVERYGNKNI